MSTHVVLFVLASSSQGIKGEALLRAAGVEAALIPMPRSLSSECGVCLRVPAEERAKGEDVLAGASIAVQAVHELDDDRSGRDRTMGRETA